MRAKGWGEGATSLPLARARAQEGAERTLAIRKASAPFDYQNATEIGPRPKDGDIDATAMCQATKRRWHEYTRRQEYGEYLEALATDTGIPASELIQSVKGDDPSGQGTWVHPRIAIDLAMWRGSDVAEEVTGQTAS